MQLVEMVYGSMKFELQSFLSSVLKVLINYFDGMGRWDNYNYKSVVIINNAVFCQKSNHSLDIVTAKFN